MTADPGTPSTDRADLRALGYATMRSVVWGKETDPTREFDLRDGGIGEEIVEIGLVSVWAELWAREGLSRRDRSLVTLGVLIALGAEDEAGNHAKFALRNGLTREELSEVIYHAAGYAGFPRALAARKAIRAALGEK